MIFTVLIKCWVRLSEAGCSYRELRLTLAVGSFRVVAHLIHSNEIFEEKSEIALRVFPLKSRGHPQQSSDSWANCCD